MARDSDGIDITLAKPKADGPSKADALPLETPGKYEQPRAGGDVELGRGGMGRVLRLEDVHLEREVALKELLPEHHPSLSQGPALANLFIREAQVLAKLEHPGVVPIYELGRRPDGTPFYAMRKVRGRALSKAIDACASLDERLSLLPALVDVAHTVGFAHAQGVVHRDLKPDNVMVGPFGETLVVDWGLAFIAGEHEHDGQLAGTPAYMSPEQVNGGTIDARSDVWAMGVMLYEVLAGGLPFDAPTVTEVLERVKTGVVAPIRRREPRVSPALAAVVTRALEHDPSRRYQDGEALATALDEALRARRPRAFGLPLVLGVVALACGWAWWSERAAGVGLTQKLTASALAASDATRARGRQLAEASVNALRSNDTFEAGRLAVVAEQDGPVPLARGVRMVLAERGAPKLEWKVPIEAGCSRLGVTSTLVACATLNGVELLDAKTGASRGRLKAGPTAGWLPALAVVSDDVVLAGADNRALFRWDLAKPDGPRTVTLPESITMLAPSAGAVLAGLRDGAIYRVRAEGAPELVTTLPTRVKALAAAGGDWAVGTDALLARFSADGKETSRLDRTVLALDYGPGDTLYAGVERSVLVLERGGATRVLSGHRDTVTAVSAGQRLASGDAEGSVLVWGTDGVLETHWRAFAPGVKALAWARDEQLLFVAPRGRSLEAWSIPPRLLALPDEGEATFQAFFPAEGLFTGLRDGRVRRVDPATLTSGFLESKHRGAVRALALVPGDRRPEALRHLTGGDDGQVLAQRWNGEVEVLGRHDDRVTALDVSADGERACWALEDGSVVLFSLKQGKEVRRFREAPSRVARFSPDSLSLVLGRDDKRALVLDAQDGKVKLMLEETDAAVISAVWRGGDLVLGLANGHVQEWSLREKRALRTFTQPDDRAGALALSADGATLAAGSDDGHVYLWDLDSGALVADVPADAGDVRSVAFVADSLFAAGSDGRVHLWPLSPP